MSDSKSVAFCFGRYNPPTYGHLQLWKTIDGADTDEKFIYASHSQDKKKNPLSYPTKAALIKYIIKSQGLDAEFRTSDVRTILEVAVDLYKEGFTDIKVVAGSDRLDDLTGLLKKYNNVPLNPNGVTYNFNSIEGISAGERDPDSDGVTGMSATKVRQFAVDGDFDSFCESVPIMDNMIAKEVYDEIRSVLVK